MLSPNAPAIAGKQDDVPRLRQCVQGLQQHHIDAGSIVHYKLQAIQAVQRALPRLPCLLPRLPRLIPAAIIAGMPIIELKRLV